MVDSCSHPQDDALIVAEVLEGRRASFMTLVTRYQHLVRTTVWNFFRHRETTEDLCQETFLKAFTNLSHLKDPAKFRSWLLQIAFHACVDHRRRHRRETPGLEEEVIEKAAAPEVLDEGRDMEDRAILGLVDRLEAVDALVVWLRYVEELSYPEIAQIVSATEVAVRQRASRAMKSMRERMT